MLLVNSCLSYSDNHGYMFHDIETDAISVGFSDKKQVLGVFGSPTITLYQSNSENWIYISEKIRNLLFFMPKTTERRVFILSFSSGNIVSDISEFDLSYQRSYNFDPDITEIDEEKPGFFDSIFGNIGQVTPQ